jgi:hypothetical protein
MGDFGQTLDGWMSGAGSVGDPLRPAASGADHSIAGHEIAEYELSGGPASVRAPTGVLDRALWNVRTSSLVRRRGRTTLWIAILGALAYNSWPLAFIVNPSLAGSALASSFEGHSEPFSWLFIVLDCVAGACTAAVCFRELRPRRGYAWPGGVLALALLAYGMFGMATAVDAVVPLNCGSASAQTCASQLWPLTPDDILTGTALFGLFVATVTIIVQMMRRPVAFPLTLPLTTTVTLIGWSVLGVIVLMWSTSATMAAVSQYAFLTLTSVLALIVPLGATAALRRSAASLVPEPVGTNELSTDGFVQDEVPYQAEVAEWEGDISGDISADIQRGVRHGLARLRRHLGEDRCCG